MGSAKAPRTPFQIAVNPKYATDYTVSAPIAIPSLATSLHTVAMDILSVARHAGVSSATVSRVMNLSPLVKESTAIRVKRAIEELGYVPNTSARSLRSGRSNLYGILVSDIRNPFFPDLIEHFESLATQHGIDVTITNTGYSEERLLAGYKRLLERGIDGIAILTSEVSPMVIKKIREARVPVVLLNQPSATAGLRNIVVDYAVGFRNAVEHLRMLGHSDIGFVAGPATLSSAVRRLKAFAAAMRACRLELRKDLLLQGDHKITGGQFAAERIFSMRRPPTAVVCSNDMMAIGMLHTAHRLGRRIPQELSLIGFDDIFLSQIVQPALTTLHLSRQEIATQAFYALLQARDETTSKSRLSVILPKLTIRESTGVAPASLEKKRTE